MGQWDDGGVSLVLLLVALAVIGVIAVVAGGRWGSLTEAPPERTPAPSLSDGDLDPAAIEGLRFPLVLRGYRMDEVDAVLARLGAAIAERDARIADLESQQPRRP